MAKMPINKLPTQTVLVTENVGGNLHQASSTINEWGLSDYVLSMSYGGDNYTVVVFRVPKFLLEEFQNHDS